MVCTAGVAPLRVAETHVTKNEVAEPPGLATLQLGMGWFPEAPGGLNRYFYDLLDHLPYSGVLAQGLVMGTDAVSATSGGRVQSVCDPRANLMRRLWSMRRCASEALGAEKWSAVVSHFALYTSVTLDLVSDRPLIVHFQGPWGLESLAEGSMQLAVLAKTRLERAVYRRGVGFITLSRAFARLLNERYGIDEGRITVIPGGVRVDRFALPDTRSEAREKLGWPKDRPIVLCVRRLVRRMGLEDLIEAIRMARHRLTGALFIIVGSGPLEGELAQRISSAALVQSVRLVGRLPDDQVALAYRAADLTVVPTIALEGFGLIVPESLAAGTPALVTPVGGLPETIRDLASQLVLPGPGPLHLAEGLQAALDGSLHLPSASACQEFARTHYDWRVIAGRVAKVYAEIAA